MSQEDYDQLIAFGRLADGRLSPDELERLEERLLADAELRRRYVRFMNLDFELEQRLAHEGPVLNLVPAPSRQIMPGSLNSPASNGFASTLFKWAAVLVLGVGASWFTYSQYFGAGDPLVLGTVWSADDSSGQWQAGADLRSGEHDFARGSYELRLSSGQEDQKDEGKPPFGVRLIVEGPARFTMDSADRVQLHSGKVSAEVLPMAKGFTITTNEVEVVDLGTRFAVTSQSSGASAIHVYDGTVETAVVASGATRDPLKTGDTVRLNLDTKKLEDIEFQSDLFAPRPTWTASLEKVSPSVHIFNRPPKDAKRDKQASSKKSFIFKERDGLILPDEIRVNLAEPGNVAAEEERWGDHVTTIPAGTQVTSYLANFAKEGDSHTAKATLKFDSPILGVIYSADLVMNTDRLLGSPDTNYRLHGNHAPGILTGLERGAWVEIHEDRRTVTFTFARPVGNQVRIIVARDPR